MNPVSSTVTIGRLVERYRASLSDLEARGIERSSVRPLVEGLAAIEIASRVREGGESALRDALEILLDYTGSNRGAWYVATTQGGLRLAAAKGVAEPHHLEGRPAEAGRALAGVGLDVVVPMTGRHGLAGLLALENGAHAARNETQAFAESLAAAAALPLEASLLEDERQRLSRRLSVKVYQLRNLFELSRELTSTFDAEAVKGLATATLMGHLMAPRGALYLRGPCGFELGLARGFRAEAADLVDEASECDVLEGAETALRVSELPQGALRARLVALRMGLVAPVITAGRCEALLMAGERNSGRPFSDEDCDFAATLARQTTAALDTVRLHEVSLEKERQDHEIEIAREIQQSLFPPALPRLPGFDLAAKSEPCFRVGGDYYDAIMLPGERLFIAVADVSGKGTPASLLMASVHAWLRARAGTAALGTLIAELNRFLCASNLANKFVTFFCAEVETASGEAAYVNAGHIPPFVLQGRGEATRLVEGGPVLGILENASYETGKVRLGAGDVLAVVTDGATEALSRDDVEYGDEGVLRSLMRSKNAAGAAIVAACFDDVLAWAGPRGLADDLTAMILKVSR